ncbi:MAG: peptidylprolyl isomerase [Alphaproteobacteria bacterium]|nr:peptidylprolyl isomerase [Alphaproteobacteria bacterium]
MVQKKVSAKKPLPKENKEVSTQKTGLPTEGGRQINYPVLSFILFVAALVIWFFVGSMFMEMAVEENFCHIRRSDKPKPAGEVVAIIGDESLYMSEVRDYAKTIPQLADMPFEVIYPQLLQAMVDSRVLRMAADKAGTIKRKEVQKALELAHEEVIAKAYLEEELKKRATTERLKALYESEIKKARPVEEIHAKHILVKTEQEAKNILIRLRAGGSFAMAANKYSLDRAAQDGDLGYFTEDDMIPEFSRAAFALQKGQISEPVQTPLGWHLILLEDRRMAEPPAFEDVKEELKELLMKQDVSKVLADERAKLKVRIRKPKLNTLKK